MNKAQSTSQRYVRAIGVAAGVGTLLTFGTPARGADNVAPASSSGSQTVHLEFRETREPIAHFSMSVQSQPKPFAKEPDCGQRKVCRGNLSFGEQSAQSVPFLWDYTQGQLYLDLNRNGNLVDDGPCARSSTGVAHFGNYYFQNFTNLHFTLKAGQLTRPLTADLDLNSPRESHAQVTLACRSFWESKVRLQGEDYQVGVVEGISGKLGGFDGAYMVLRPWAERQRRLSTQDGSLDAFEFCPNLFYQNQAYRVDFELVQHDATAKYKLNLQERTAELGDLKLTGKFIERIVLSASETRQGQPRFTVILDRPASSVKVPLGGYTRCDFHLKAEGVEAHSELARYNRNPAAVVTIRADAGAVLRGGGPLTNTITATRQAQALALAYHLEGDDGGTYQLLNEDRRHPPQFTVYKKGKVIGSGKFEYG